jgi:Xaa-Pro aminopeptidase
MGLVEGLRTVKDPDELASMQEAVSITDEAMARVIPTIKPGQTERQIAWALEVAMREMGAEGLSFETIVAAGPNAAMAHHRPDETPIQKGQTIVIDMGCKVHGYCSDQTRTVYIGPQDELFEKLYDLTLGAQLTAIETVTPGMSGADGDSLARTVIKEAGYGDQFGHGLGHGSGLAVHEDPRVTMGSQQTLKEGMVFSIEPGVYIGGWGGIRIEDLVVLENGRARSLSRAPKTPDWEGALR